MKLTILRQQNRIPARNRYVTACALLAVLAALPAAAQKFGDFDAGSIDMDAMVSKAGEVQECMSKVDQDELARLQKEAEAVQEEIRGLCADNKRKKAQSRAIKFGQQLEQEQVVKEVQACTGLADQAIPQMAWTKLDESEQVRQHVCDL